MNTRYIMKKQGFGLLCLLGIMGLSSCTNESEEQTTLGGDLLMELTAQVNQVKTRASSESFPSLFPAGGQSCSNRRCSRQLSVSLERTALNRFGIPHFLNLTAVTARNRFL